MTPMAPIGKPHRAGILYSLRALSDLAASRPAPWFSCARSKKLAKTVRRVRAPDPLSSQELSSNSFKKKWYLLNRHDRGTRFFDARGPVLRPPPASASVDRHDEPRQ